MRHRRRVGLAIRLGLWLALGHLLGLTSCGPSSVNYGEDAAIMATMDDARIDAPPRPDARVTGPPPTDDLTWPYDDGSTGAWKDPSLSDDVKGWFEGTPATTGAPALVYPLDRSLHPHNVPNLTAQWKQGSASWKAFRVELAGAGKTFRFYLACTTAQCEKPLASNYWVDAGRRLAGGEVKLTVAGASGPGVFAVSAARTIAFSPQPLKGALYYWAAENRTIKRASLGATKAVPFIEPSSPSNAYACVACHSVSRNGKVIAFAVTPLEDPTKPYIAPKLGTSPFPPDLRHDGAITQGPVDHFGHNVALSPDGEIAAINGVDVSGWPPTFELRNTRTGATLGSWQLGDAIFGGANLLPIFPEWSPDGTQLAVTLADSTGDTDTEGCVWSSSTCRSSIAIIPVTGSGATRSLGAPRIVVPASGTQYHFYPSWSPDGKWLVFASATYKRGNPQQSESNPSALLRLVHVDGKTHTCPGAECIELTRGMQYSVADAGAGKGKQSTWPKFAPFDQDLGGGSGNLLFVSMSSRIDYGFHSQPIGDSGHSQLWLFAVDVAKVGSGDPSYAPVWLPYQDMADGSLSAYWTTTLPCQTDPQGGCAGCVGEESCVVTADSCYCSVD